MKNLRLLKKLRIYKKRIGFTLIELLVVIAIITLVSLISLVTIVNSRNRAKDARITADMSQIRAVAKIIMISEGGDYAKLSCSFEEMETLCDDIASQSSDKNHPIIVLSSDKKKYCAYKILNSKKAGNVLYYCIDSAGRAEEVDFNPGDAGEGNCHSAGNISCEPI